MVHCLQLAVLLVHQRKGIGRAIMLKMQEHCDKHHPDLLQKMHAQVHALQFYQSLGWEECGDKFDEAGIEHVTMLRVVANPAQLRVCSDDRVPAYIRQRVCMR
jgi:predicted GNAT family N-acyltransferase